MKTLSTPTDLARLIQSYFCSYLINQRRVSKHTVGSYRDMFRLLLPFVAIQQNKSVSSLGLMDITSEVVILFLQHLEEQRNNRVQTRNARLSAIRSFLNYAAVEEPEALPTIQQVLAIPEKCTHRFLFEYLEKNEIEALLKVQDLATWSGRRDHALLLTLYNTGARVSEIIRIQLADIDMQKQHAIHLHGKGRKERIIPLWPQTIAELRKWQVNLKYLPNSPLFPNRYGDPLTRFGVTQRLDCAIKNACDICPSLKGRKISPHTIRHTTAMHLLQSGVDLTVIALWLGHEKIETTHQYMEANLEMKRKALAKLSPIDSQSSSSSDKPSEDVLAFLESL